MPETHRHPIFARVYPRISRAAELAGAADHRRRLLAGLTGGVVEVGAGHGWMMMVCCIPMIVIVIALVATGVASAGILLSAIACIVMMAMMMRMMSGTK